MTDGHFPMNDSDDSSSSTSSSSSLLSSSCSVSKTANAFITSAASSSASNVRLNTSEQSASCSRFLNESSLHQSQQSVLSPKVCKKENIRTFVFSTVQKRSSGLLQGGSTENLIDELSIQIPEQLQSSYSFYTWPCAPILAWYLWERRNCLPGLHVLELGCGTALPGLLAAKCGAKVTLTDNCILAKTLAHIRQACNLNGLIPGKNIEVLGVTWGLLLNSLFSLDRVDLIIAADCFYDPTVFEDILVSISFLLEQNPAAKFIFSYQERSADWSIEALLKKWQLCAKQINIDSIGKVSGVDLIEVFGNHTIYLIEITRQGQEETSSQQIEQQKLDSRTISDGSENTLCGEI